VNHDTAFRKIFASDTFDSEVEALTRLFDFGNNHALSNNWTVRVPALLSIDRATASVAMERAGGGTIDDLVKCGAAIPWTHLGEAIGRYHTTACAVGALLHDDLSFTNLMIDATHRTIWLIDPWARSDKYAPAGDLLQLLFAICRSHRHAGADFIAGWNLGAGRHLSSPECQSVWPAVHKRLTGRHSRKNIPAGLRELSYLAFLYAWLPLVLWAARRRSGDPKAVKTAGVAKTST